MKLKLTKIIASALIILSATAIVATTTYATSGACGELEPGTVAYKAAGCDGSKDALPDIIKGILLAIIGVAGVVAVIYTIIGGYQYMASAGDPQKTAKAKNTILYALIGLAICVLSFAIVNFTITGIINNKESSQQDPGNQQQDPGNQQQDPGNPD